MGVSPAGRLADQAVCGDLPLVQPFPNGALVAVVDGVGHGAEAAAAAHLAVATLRAHAQESILPLLRRCHETLRETRGVVLTLASFNAAGRDDHVGGRGQRRRGAAARGREDGPPTR